MDDQKINLIIWAHMKIISNYCIYILIWEKRPITEMNQLFEKLPISKFVYTILEQILKLSRSPDGSNGSYKQCRKVI